MRFFKTVRKFTYLPRFFVRVDATNLYRVIEIRAASLENPPSVGAPFAGIDNNTEWSSTGHVCTHGVFAASIAAYICVGLFNVQWKRIINLELRDNDIQDYLTVVLTTASDKSAVQSPVTPALPLV